MRQFVGQGQRFVVSLLGLVWIAQKPQGKGHRGEAGHLGVIHDTKGAMLLEIVESNPCFQVLSGLGKLSEVKQSYFDFCLLLCPSFSPPPQPVPVSSCSAKHGSLHDQG